MRKFKICITIFLLYELAILTILQMPRYCDVFFTNHFCGISFRYFLMCLLVPCLIALFVWWMPDVSNMFCKKCQCKDDDKEIGVNQDIERLIATVLVTGIQKFIVNHPKTTETLSDILKTFIKTKGKKRLTK